MRLFAATLISLVPVAGTGQNANPVEMLKEVVSAVCEPIEDINSGELIKSYLEADASVRLDGVLKRFVEAGVEGAADFEVTNYTNGLANDALAGEISSQRDCNLIVYSDFSGAIQSWIERDSSGNSVTIDQSGSSCSQAVVGNGNTSNIDCQ